LGVILVAILDPLGQGWAVGVIKRRLVKVKREVWWKVEKVSSESSWTCDISRLGTTCCAGFVETGCENQQKRRMQTELVS